MSQRKRNVTIVANDLQHVIKTIKSCDTFEQLENCQNLIDNFYIKAEGLTNPTYAANQCRKARYQYDKSKKILKKAYNEINS
jgi:hypothetical protein